MLKRILPVGSIAGYGKRAFYRGSVNIKAGIQPSFFIDGDSVYISAEGYALLAASMKEGGNH